jgi:hypothetical protein
MSEIIVRSLLLDLISKVVAAPPDFPLPPEKRLKLAKELEHRERNQDQGVKSAAFPGPGFLLALSIGFKSTRAKWPLKFSPQSNPTHFRHINTFLVKSSQKCVLLV